jgi:biotin synthase-related radical SAM superfamily protein
MSKPTKASVVRALNREVKRLNKLIEEIGDIPIGGSGPAFVPISCDACGRPFGGDDEVFVMAFRPSTPDGASADICYAVCAVCAPKIGKDDAVTEGALMTAQARLDAIAGTNGTQGGAS